MNGVFVVDRLYPCVGLVEHEPDPWTRRVVLCQPRPPLSATANLKRQEFCRHADWLPLRLSTDNSTRPQLKVERQERHISMALNLGIDHVVPWIIGATPTCIASSDAPFHKRIEIRHFWSLEVEVA